MLWSISVFIRITENIKLIISSFILPYLQIALKRAIIKSFKTIFEVAAQQKAEPNKFNITRGQFITNKPSSVLHESNKTNKHIHPQNLIISIVKNKQKHLIKWVWITIIP